MRFIFTSLIFLTFTYQNTLIGTYVYKGKSKSFGGTSKYIATLEIKEDSTYQFLSSNLNKYSGDVIDSDTVNGNWYIKNDTLFTEGLKFKWVVKKNKLIQKSYFKDLVYQKQK